MEISIIGGGITGLTTALALQKVGLPSKVYERSNELNEIGAGVWLQPNAVQILKWLGLYEEVLAKGCLLNKMEITYPNLQPIKRMKQTVVSDRYGNQTLAIHRCKLQRILYDSLIREGEVELGKTYQSHFINGDKVSIQFDDEKRDTDILLGADGIKSKVRATMGLNSVYRPSGQICCRGIANIDLPENLKNEGKEMWGRKRRFGFSQLSDTSVYFFIVFNREIGPDNFKADAISDLFNDFDPIVRSIINASSDMHVTELEDLKRLTTWYEGKTCLIGDAAHATTPNMGQGACQGIEDAYYLSRLLKDYDTSSSDAFQKFESHRRQKVDYVVNNSWNFGKMSHDPFGQFFLKFIMKCTPESVMSNQMNKLYAIDGL